MRRQRGRPEAAREAAARGLQGAAGRDVPRRAPQERFRQDRHPRADGRRLMDRMAGVDAGYLYMETPTMHMHTLKIALVEPSEPFEFDRLTRELLGRLHRLPPFTRRALPVPFALNHPLWIADHEIDPARHI